jgi:hypothetical protein
MSMKNVWTAAALWAAVSSVCAQVTTSVLADGRVYKIGIEETGVYKLDYAFLKEKLGVDDLDNIDPRTLKIYGNGGGMLPEANSVPRIDDLAENAIEVVGEGDGQFGEGDYVLLYAVGPDVWKYDGVKERFSMVQHVYSEQSYYFLKISSGNGKRVPIQSVVTTCGGYSTNTFDGYARHEVESQNLMANSTSYKGTGRVWFGETFGVTTERTFEFDFPNLVTTEPLWMNSYVAARTIGASSSFRYKLNETVLTTVGVSSITGSSEADIARGASVETVFNSTQPTVPITVEYVQPNSAAEGWLNHIELNVRRALTFTGGQMPFRDKRAFTQATTFQLGNVSGGGVSVWEVSNPQSPEKITLSGGSFCAAAGQREFIAFDGTAYLTPKAAGRVATQNLHALSPSELVIIYHPNFQEAAEQLAEHRRVLSGISVATVEIGSIYNEFASGAQDITAIRDFLRMLYKRQTATEKLKYVLLMGDASFDYRSIKYTNTNTNYIPTYQTPESFNPVSGFPTDDYYTLLDDTDGGTLYGAMDVSIGRFPVRTLEDATKLVQKIIDYETHPESFGDWRLRNLFNADDQDNNRHLADTEEITQYLANNQPNINVDKNYFDAYVQQVAPGGDRYPEATDYINNSVFKGTLVINYLGHGGSGGWAQERVLSKEDMNGWTNRYKLPLFVTATCTFAPYDDPSEVPAGELILLNPNGGGIALFTTVRLVLAASNGDLASSIFQNLYKPLPDGTMPTIGDVMRIAKNANNDLNSRKFAILGDPSMRLAYPTHQIETTHINGKPITHTDTIQGLQNVTIQGQVTDRNGNLLTNYNGILTPTVYDKPDTLLTQANDSGSKIQKFLLQRKVIFKGQVSVVNGKFTFTFTVPQDINLNYGYGKISYYAHNGTFQNDAAGYYNDLIIGGIYKDQANDNQAPTITLYMNNEQFVSGGITDSNPLLIAQIADDFGINTVGNSIGHDITATLDDGAKIYVLNDFYEATIDNPLQGTIRYPLYDLAVGTHTLRLKVWDISNNSSEKEIQFVVQETPQGDIQNIKNYPNPLQNTGTTFHFTHTLTTPPTTVVIDIFNTTGQHIADIQRDLTPDDNNFFDIPWDGYATNGNPLPNGVYFYRISLQAGTNNEYIYSPYSKMLIMR